MEGSGEKDWEVVGPQPGASPSPFKRARTALVTCRDSLKSLEPLFTGTHSQFHLSRAELPALPDLVTREALQQVLERIWSDLPGQYQKPEADPTNGSHPFVDMMLPAALQARTENGALTYAASGSALLDFFYQIVEDSTCADVHALLPKAWAESPLDTLQLVAQLRDIRNGKAERARAHDALIWLSRNHPRTLLANLPEVVKVGYYKDLLELAAQLVSGEEEHAAKEARQGWRMEHKGANHVPRKAAKHARLREWRAALKDAADPEAARKERAAHFAAKLQADMQEARRQRHDKQLASIERARRLYDADPVYRALHLSVALIFAAALRQDMARLLAGKRVSSLAAKWAPTPKASHDRATLLASTIAELLYPESQYRPEGMPHEEYVEIARRAYHKQYLVPLRRNAKCPEVFMSAGQWDQIDYGRVPSVCMEANKKNFEYWDKERFSAFLGRVKTGEAKVAAGALKPHKLVAEALQASGFYGGTQDSSELSLETMEAQWRAYVQQMKESGRLSSALALCDVSGSMSGQPLQVALALSLLTAEVTAPPFHRLICTTSEQPVLHLVQGLTLVEKVRDMTDTEFGLNTNFDAVFALLLERALQTRLAPADMVQTLFVFSDMEFDEAAGNGPKFDHAAHSARREELRAEVHARFGHELTAGVLKAMREAEELAIDRAYDNEEKDFEIDAYDEHLEEARAEVHARYGRELCDEVMGGMEEADRIANKEALAAASAPAKPTNFDAITARFEAAGYKLPQIVFWNLRASSIPGQKSTPVTMHESGAALMSGFSGHLLKIFMSKAGGDVDALREELSPLKVLQATIKERGRYDGWRVVD